MADRETLLIVDDEPDARDLCERIFRETYEIISASTGAEALAKIEGIPIALALSDQRMPNMTGLEMLIELGKTQPAAARVVMTGYTDLEDVVALINEGRIQGFVLKPWNNHQLRLTVDREIENYRRARTIERLHEQLRKEHTDMLDLLRELDPDFAVPLSNDQLKDSKLRLRQKVANEVEKLFLKELLEACGGNISEAARIAAINRTFLYRLMKRHGIIGENEAAPV